MLNAMFALGAQRKHIVAKVAGAGSPLGQEETFRIGERNYTILRKLLWRNNILIDTEDVGGTKARTLFLYLEDGLVTVKSGGKEIPL
jgi:chemotaxis protein CheD